MARVEYKYELYIITHESKDDKGNMLREVERINIPIDSFEVDGGADRKLNITTKDDFVIASEFEQARIHKNIIFYVPPTKDFLALKLLDLRKNGPEQFDITFVNNIFSDRKLVRSLRFSTESAWFFRHPELVGGKSPVLKCWIRFNNPQILHGQFDPTLKKVVHKAI